MVLSSERARAQSISIDAAPSAAAASEPRVQCGTRRVLLAPHHEDAQERKEADEAEEQEPVLGHGVWRVCVACGVCGVCGSERNGRRRIRAVLKRSIRRRCLKTGDAVVHLLVDGKWPGVMGWVGLDCHSAVGFRLVV